jgi:hypothetical protein
MIATVASAAVSAAGTLAAGRAQQAAGRWQEREYGRQADSEMAAGQREAEERQRQARLLQARLQTVGAASGLSATDPTALTLTGDIERQGRLQEALAVFGGEDRATGLEAQGRLARFSGDAARTGSVYSAIGTMLGGAGSGLARYRETGRPQTGAGAGSYQGWG